MCYAIPGKVVRLEGFAATIEYFDETKKAHTGLASVAVGDYVYAQGGFVIQTVPEDEAMEIMAEWRRLFFRLRDTDRKLAAAPRTLYERANAVRQKKLGNSCCVHGILEFSSHCAANCLYCGLRRDNSAVGRYRMTEDEILDAVEYAVKELGFKALVLQSGEDPWYDEAKLARIVSGILKRCPVLLIVSIGPRPLSTYAALYKAGARGVLMRFETSNPDLFGRMKPGASLDARLELIRGVRELGYMIITGFLAGLPGGSNRDTFRNIRLTAELGAEMFSFGPFIPHPETPLSAEKLPPLGSMLDTIARARLMNPEANILVTTALETLDKDNGAREGLMAGANSLMINVTPVKYRRQYEIYPGRAGVEDDVPSRIQAVVKLLNSLGRAPTDIGR